MNDEARREWDEAHAQFAAAVRRYGALGTDETREAWVRATRRLAEVEARYRVAATVKATAR